MASPFLADTHIHSDNSGDAVHSVTLLCEYAERAGLGVVAITDHCDIDLYHKYQLEKRLAQSFLDARRAAGIYSDKRLEVLAGVELAQGLRERALTEKILSVWDFDYVIMSQHSAEGMAMDFGDMTREDYQSGKHDFAKLLLGYYEEIVRVCRDGFGDSLAHLTYPLRYFVEYGVKFDMKDSEAYIREALKILAETGKALEVNTSGLRQTIGETFPPRKYIEWFRELGGEYVTIGSDAHNCRDVGAGVREAAELLKSCGFLHAVYFKKRRPVSYKL